MPNSLTPPPHHPCPGWSMLPLYTFVVQGKILRVRTHFIVLKLRSLELHVSLHSTPLLNLSATWNKLSMTLCLRLGAMWSQDHTKPYPGCTITRHLFHHHLPNKSYLKNIETRAMQRPMIDKRCLCVFLNMFRNVPLTYLSIFFLRSCFSF